MRTSKVRRTLAVAVMAATTGSILSVVVNAEAATVDTYRVELKAWIPHASVTGPPIAIAGICNNPTGTATYNGNNHVGYDGDYKALVAYEFTYDGARMADKAVDITYGETIGTTGLCTYRDRATSSGAVKVKGGGVELSMDTGNPLVPGSPPINAALNLRMAGRDEMVLRHTMDAFPSHGFRVWRNGQVIATAVDFDASCKNATGKTGAATIARGLTSSGTPIEHDLDTRVAGQAYFGPCGASRPAPFRFPVPSAPAPKPVPNTGPVASFTVTRLPGPGNQVRLDASGSRDADGSINEYRWSRGATALGRGKVLVAPLGAGSSAQVTLTVVDNNGATASSTRSVSLGNRQPRITGVTPAAGTTSFGIRPTLAATAQDDDADALQYAYRVTGNGVDLSSGWQAGAWQVPPHSLDPGSVYEWSVQVRDNRGGSASRTTPLRIAMMPTAKQLIGVSSGDGYWQVASDGGVFSYGTARFFGSLPGLGVKVDNIIGMARTPTDRGYWLVGRDGGVFAFGDAAFRGSLPGLDVRVNNIVGMAPTKTGNGYWLVGSDGGVFAFGDAPFHGSMGGKPLNAPVEAIAPTASGNGYWLGARDGGVFAFGDAPFHGSMGGKPLNAPVVDLQVTPDGRGYWLAAEDGGVFAFGSAAFHGSMAGKPLNGRVTSLSPTPTGAGYWLNACDGGVFAFGDAPFYGSNAVYGCRGI